MASYQGKLGCEWPVTIYGVEISVADAGVFDVDENFIWAGLCNWTSVSTLLLVHRAPYHTWNLLVIDGSSGLLDDHSPLLLWNIRCHCSNMDVLIIGCN